VSIPDFSLIIPEADFCSKRRGRAGIRLWFYFMRYQSKVRRWQSPSMGKHLSKSFDNARIFAKFCDMPSKLNPPEM